MKPKIFVSYSSTDDAFVKKLIDALQTSKAFEIWHDSYNLRSGDVLTEQIEQGVKYDTNISLFYLSKSALASEWVRREFEWARQKERGLIVYVIDEESTRKDLGKWKYLPASRILIVNNDCFHKPLIELTNSMLASFYRNYYPNIDIKSVLEAAYQKGISRTQFGRFTGEDDRRLEELIANSKEIKLLVMNGSAFIQSFKTSLGCFAEKNDTKMKVLLSDENSLFYNENSKLVSPLYDENDDNKELVGRAIGRLSAIFINHPEKLEMKKYNTQFRLPIIIFDNKIAHLTINLTPSESIEGMTFELFSKQSSATNRYNPAYIIACVKHFDAIYEQAELTTYG